jgi:hypothetical protein
LMPRIFRSMKQDADGKPIVGQSATALGVRVPRDIAPDAAGMVHPGKGGMSVAPHLRDLPPQRVPSRLRHLVPRATGKESMHVWIHGEGPFAASPVALGLVLAPDRPGHGSVQPDQTMMFDDYEKALAATRDQWAIDETGN